MEDSNESPRLSFPGKNKMNVSQQIRSSARFEAKSLKEKASKPVVIEVADQRLRPRLDSDFRDYASYVNCLSTDVGSNFKSRELSKTKTQYLGKSPYAVFRKNTLQKVPEIVSESRRAELEDFQKELKLFIT